MSAPCPFNLGALEFSYSPQFITFSYEIELSKKEQEEADTIIQKMSSVGQRLARQCLKRLHDYEDLRTIKVQGLNVLFMKTASVVDSAM